MVLLRKRILIFLLLGMVLAPQLYQAIHVLGHRHDVACIEINTTHIHQKELECNWCVHVVPGFFTNTFDDFSVQSNTFDVLLKGHYVDIFTDRLLTFFWLRGPPHMFFC